MATGLVLGLVCFLSKTLLSNAGASVLAVEAPLLVVAGDGVGFHTFLVISL